MRMRYILPLIALLSLAGQAPAQGKNTATPAPTTRPYADVKNSQLRKELIALDEAADLLAEVKDDKSAKEACSKINRLFRNLPPLLGGGTRELDLLAKAQNRVSAQMWRLKNEPFFEKYNMQQSWTIMTDQFSRKLLTK